MSVLAQRASLGVAWTLGRTAIQLVLGIGASAILARLLAIEDFGLMALAMAFIQLGEAVGSLGMGAAIIQRPRIRQSHVDTAISWSVIMGAALFAIYALSAPFIASAYKAPVLAPVLICLGLAQWIAIVGAVPRGLLRRHLRFRTLTLIEIASYVLGYTLVSLLCAWWWRDVWSLVAATLAWHSSATLAAWWATRMRWKPIIDRAASRGMLNFGGTFTLKMILTYVGSSLDSLLIGHFLGPYALGLYNRANQLASLPVSRIAGTVSQVMFPVYSLLQDDTEKLRAHFLDALGTVSLICAPMLLVMMSIPETIVNGLYGERWGAAAPVLRFLALAGIVNLLHHLAGAVVEAKNRIGSELWLQLGYLLLLVAGIVWLAAQGLTIVCLALVLAALWLYVSMFWLVWPLLDLTPQLKRWVWVQAQGLLLGLFLALLAWTLDQSLHSLSASVRLGLIAASCASVDLAALYLLPGSHWQWLPGRRLG